ncbi:hypothetical protein CIPAW_02G034200 [Carya illinoinensis]|uniref:Uncharacterized protein n=1 Tax=Carya illinoinensis TaxID=32201 RepID=A0A8T1R845_CARIL|nr:hypothetical protein CIPAW_02G034200 [Carya illinoinensis]
MEVKIISNESAKRSKVVPLIRCAFRLQPLRSFSPRGCSHRCIRASNCTNIRSKPSCRIPRATGVIIRLNIFSAQWDHVILA